MAFSKTDLEPLPVGPCSVADRRSRAGPHQQHAERQPGHIFRRDRLRQLFMVNGVDIKRQPVRDGQQTCSSRMRFRETNILTGGISAEYGRFFQSGASTWSQRVVATRSAGASARTSATPSGLTKGPRQKGGRHQNADILSKTSEATFGRPISKIGCGSSHPDGDEQANNHANLHPQRLVGARSDTNKRGEIKFDRSPAMGRPSPVTTRTQHGAEQSLQPNQNSLDRPVLISETQPNSLFVVNYNGVLANKYFSPRCSTRKRSSASWGGRHDTAISASPFRTRWRRARISSGLLYAAPFFSGARSGKPQQQGSSAGACRTRCRRRCRTHESRAAASTTRSQADGRELAERDELCVPVRLRPGERQAGV